MIKKRHSLKKLNKDKNKNMDRSSGIKVGAKRFILFAATGILAGSSIFMTVVAATSSVEVASLRERQKVLAAEKRNMENTLAESLSVSDLEEKSGDMGYTEPINLVYIKSSDTVAANLP